MDEKTKFQIRACDTIYSTGISELGILARIYEKIGQKKLDSVNQRRKYYLSGCAGALTILFGINPTGLIGLTEFLFMVVSISLLGITIFVVSEICMSTASKRNNSVDDQIQSAITELKICQSIFVIKTPPYTDCTKLELDTHIKNAVIIAAAVFYNVLNTISKYEKYYNKHHEFKQIEPIAERNNQTCNNILTRYTPFKISCEYPTSVHKIVNSTIKDLKSKQQNDSE